MRKGTGYLGTSKIETSIANQEIIPNSPSHWTHGYQLYKFSFLNIDQCVVKINNETEIFLSAGQGFEMDKNDHPISSFKVLTESVQYSWVGAF